MSRISSKTLSDLEFKEVCLHIKEYCVTTLGQDKALKIKPFNSRHKAITELKQVGEYKSSDLEDKPIPRHGFDDISSDLKRLSIEGSILEEISFVKFKDISETANELIKFFRQNNHLYPNLHNKFSKLYFTPDIIISIENIINKFGEVKDDASENLAVIRQEIQVTRSRIGSSFSKALGQYQSMGYLADIKESLTENIRTLAVKAMYRRKVKGKVLGQSKTGSIVYIQPDSTDTHTRNLLNLLADETQEKNKILQQLTEDIRPYYKLLVNYTKTLSDLDLIYAKKRYADEINGILPEITADKRFTLKNAYHPLLLATNRKIGEKTYPQDISLNKDQQIIVISGPNAGGKSITLKTVGLLQLMLQSGILIPVHEYSQVCFFDNILTDIGDNQSIENHLSTYSYRLKNMRNFLKKCDDQTLFLIDEFGTGTDPELGGALAETFLEVFYEKGAFGIITTHYANLKKMATETKGISNANMMFDSNNLKPIFKLKTGEAGSSFTFEVAQKNGIPFSLINRSKKKVERGKLRFDKSIAKLQQERRNLTKTKKELSTKTTQADQEQKRLDTINEKLQKKLESFQTLYDSNQKLISLGQKLNNMGERYFNHKNKKKLIAEFLSVIEKENTKRTKLNKKERVKQKRQKAKTEKEMHNRIDKIREKKKKAAKEEAKRPPKPKPKLHEGDSVRLQDGKAVGTIDRFEKQKAIVNYGAFTTSVQPEMLELVKSAK
ncbi:endonuclease MutS2 [Mesohalobacter halotolerans]|uniref:DNA mismatch repair protein MutS n=1 Tax=Mesohalobacter halotolerans TaxID=1883405 RepID=A0A4U5TQE4_9FLAO|nr:DNA mismatch repair protein MutS [Mesohalobacter halotolerans]TKS56417.1 DNA mismatch repair protein MutS [Mesohalobacter halotolerans]